MSMGKKCKVMKNVDIEGKKRIGKEIRNIDIEGRMEKQKQPGKGGENENGVEIGKRKK